MGRAGATQTIRLCLTDPIRLPGLLRLLSAGLMAVQVKTPLPGCASLVCSAAPLAQSQLSHKHAHPPQSFTHWPFDQWALTQPGFAAPSTSKTLNQILPLLWDGDSLGKAGAWVSWTCLVAAGWSTKDMQWYERLYKTCGKLLCDVLWGESAARLCKCQVDENGHLYKVYLNLKGGPFDVWHTR